METKFLEISKEILSGRRTRTGSNIVGSGDYMFSLAPDGSPARRYGNQTFPESDINSTINATPAILNSGSNETFALSDGMTLNITVDSASWTVTFSASDFVNIAAALSSEVSLAITNAGIGVTGYGLSGKVYIKTDSVGNSATLQVTGGTANAVLNFSTTAVTGGNEFNISADSYQNLTGWMLGDYSEVSQSVNLRFIDSVSGSFRGSCDEDLKTEQWCFSILIDGVVRAYRIIDSRDLTFIDIKAPVPDILVSATVTLRLQIVPGSDYDQVLTPSLEVDLTQGTRGYSGTAIYLKNSFSGIPTLQYWWILLFGHNLNLTWWDSQGNSGDLGVATINPILYTATYTGTTPQWVSGSSANVYLTVRPYTECTDKEKRGLFIASDDKCLELGGVDSYINIPDSDSLDVGDEFVMMATLKPLDLNDRYIFHRKSGAVVSYALKTGDRDLSIYYECDSESVDSGLELDTGWNYIAVIVDNANLTFILFNSSGLQTASKVRTKVTPTQTADLNIGSDLVNFINARIEKVALYTEKISQSLGETFSQGRLPAMGDLRILFYLTKDSGTNIRDFSLSQNHGIIQGSSNSWEQDAPETYSNGIGLPDLWQ